MGCHFGQFMYFSIECTEISVFKRIFSGRLLIHDWIEECNEERKESLHRGDLSANHPKFLPISRRIYFYSANNNKHTSFLVAWSDRTLRKCARSIVPRREKKGSETRISFFALVYHLRLTKIGSSLCLSMGYHNLTEEEEVDEGCWIA